MANTSKRGFASMDPAKQREIASKGGRAAHSKGTAHEFTSDEARVAGRKGGEAVSRDRAHMSAIGREGGHSRGARARAVQGSSPGISEIKRSRQVDEERDTFVTNSGTRPAPTSSERPNYGASDRSGDEEQRPSRENL